MTQENENLNVGFNVTGAGEVKKAFEEISQSSKEFALSVDLAKQALRDALNVGIRFGSLKESLSTMAGDAKANQQALKELEEEFDRAASAAGEMGDSNEAAVKKFQIATQAAMQYRTNIESLKKQILELAATEQMAGNKKLAAYGIAAASDPDTRKLVPTALAEVERESLAVVREKQAALGQELALERQITAEKKVSYREDQIQIKRVKEMILDLMKSKKMTAEQALASPQVQGGGFSQAQLSAGFFEASKGASGFQQSLVSLGTVAKFVFGSVLGITAVGVLRSVVDWFVQAAQSGKEFAQSVFEMEVGIRALQRVGMEVTIGDFYNQIEKTKQQFGIFTTKQLVEGASQFANLTREMGFTKDQLFELMDASLTLSVVNGKAIDDTQRTIALALSSGYTEGLQRLGISINRVTIAEKAAALGYADSYNALTEVQRAEATRLLILERTAAYQDDLLEYQKTAPGQIDAANAAFQNQADIIGRMLAPVWAFLASNLAKAFVAFVQIIRLDLANVFKPVLYVLHGVQVAVDYISDILSGKAPASLEEFARRMSKVTEIVYDSLRKIFFPEYSQGLGDETGQRQEDVEAANEKLADAMTEAEKEIGDILEDSAEKQRDLAEDLQRDLEDIERDGQRKREQLARDHARKLEDINRDLARDTAKEGRDLARDLAEIDRDAASEAAELKEKERRKEEEEEARFLEKMRQMREEYLFDLEDAVRKRDAAAIRRLTRKYKLEREQAIREHELDLQFGKRDLSNELADLEAERQAKRQKRMEEYAERIADMQADAAFRRNEEMIRYAQELEDLNRNLAEQRADRLEKYRQDMEDLQRSINDRLRKVAEGLAKEYQLTAEGMRKIYQELVAYYGQNGLIDQLYANMRSAPTSGGRSRGSTSGVVPGRAEGGMDIFTRPTLMMYGDRGPEAVQAIPLGRQGVNVNRVSGSLPAGLSMPGSGGKMEVRIGLAPGLVAEIVDQSLDEMNNIMVRVEREG